MPSIANDVEPPAFNDSCNCIIIIKIWQDDPPSHCAIRHIDEITTQISPIRHGITKPDAMDASEVQSSTRRVLWDLGTPKTINLPIVSENETLIIITSPLQSNAGLGLPQVSQYPCIWHNLYK